MCGRPDQGRVGIAYALAMGCDTTREVFGNSQAIPRVNAPPGTYRSVFRLVEGKRTIEDRLWYRSIWGAHNGRQRVANARMDKITGTYWSNQFSEDRCIVPADGWYEWTGPEGARLPWYIHPRDRAPSFMAGITALGDWKEHRAGSGFAMLRTTRLAGSLTCMIGGRWYLQLETLIRGYTPVCPAMKPCICCASRTPSFLPILNGIV